MKEYLPLETKGKRLKNGKTPRKRIVTKFADSSSDSEENQNQKIPRKRKFSRLKNSSSSSLSEPEKENCKEDKKIDRKISKNDGKKSKKNSFVNSSSDEFETGYSKVLDTVVEVRKFWGL